MSDKIRGQGDDAWGQDAEETSKDRANRRQQFAVSISTAAEVYHEIGNALSVLVPKMRLLRKHFQQINELLSEFRKIDPNSSSSEVREAIIRCRSLAAEGPGIDRHLKKVDRAFDPCFRELEVIKVASEHLRGKRPESGLGVSVDPKEELRSTIALFHDHLREVEGIKLTLGKGYDELSKTEPYKLACTPDEFSYIFKNLIKNAVDAINERKRRGLFKAGEEPSIEVDITRIDGYARITCRDTGIGISEEIKRKIFNPFFTTKSATKGTGVGLSIVKEVIERREGTISVDSEEGEGTEFAVELPIHGRGSNGK
ncbi:MAG: HAMP domain-containing histidine kinase [Candidatus Coatesbacteria bacterium]|nr:HAMP domain-containing histidine kinase [Candidatus Coatesbacteria bacterium]